METLIRVTCLEVVFEVVAVEVEDHLIHRRVVHEGFAVEALLNWSRAHILTDFQVRISTQVHWIKDFLDKMSCLFRNLISLPRKVH